MPLTPEDKAKYRARRKAWRRANPEEYRAKKRAEYAKNRERNCARERERKKRLGRAHLDVIKAWRDKNRPKVRLAERMRYKAKREAAGFTYNPAPTRPELVRESLPAHVLGDGAALIALVGRHVPARYEVDLRADLINEAILHVFDGWSVKSAVVLAKRQLRRLTNESNFGVPVDHVVDLV